MDSYRTTLLGLGLPDSALYISTVPRVKTPAGEAVPIHGVDVARLVYIHRIRKQLAKAFKSLAEGDLLKVLSSPPLCLLVESFASHQRIW